MKHKYKYNLNVLNCANSVYHMFETEIDILEPKSFELKNRVREYVKTNSSTNKKVEFSSFIYYAKLRDYFGFGFNEK
ncbi:MAG: hypothetical protein ACOVMG_00455, partial [Flavobacterium sp.]